MTRRRDSFSGALREVPSLQTAGERRTFAAGEIVFSAGDPGDGFYVIEVGRVEILAPLVNGSPRVLATIEAGDFFGEMAVLDQAPRSATARAALHTQARFLSREELLALLEQEPAIALKLMREFSLRIRALNRKYVDEILQAERLALIGRFAGTIVHDFKNPLTIIGLASELACSDDTPARMRAQAQQKIARQVDRMSNMLQELIEFSRPTGQKTTLRPMKLPDFLDPLIDELRHELADRRVRLVACTTPRVKVRVDSARLSRLIYNLTTNAVEAMAEGGKIYVTCTEHPAEVQIDIQDTGPGIAPEIVGALFQPFATFGKTNGTGLGLSICKRIVEDHRGRIWASNPRGGGAMFSFTLPLAEV